MQAYELTATQAAELIAAKELSCEELARSCLARIEEREPVLRAWSYIDPDLVLRNARELDKLPHKGQMHGLTWGVKDVFNTFDMPTAYNSPMYVGHWMAKDAACVAIARSHGGLILGKNETAEFAAGGRRALTCNAYHPHHTPGASSSGSAAAVGDKMVQLAFATQTGGSLIRPAAYNGIYGFKPTHGVVSNEGAKMYAPSLDTVGWYGRSVDDLLLVARVFKLNADGPLRRVRLNDLRVGVCRGPNWRFIEPEGEAALLTAAKRLEEAGATVQDFDLPAMFDDINELHRTLMRGEGRITFLDEYAQHFAMLHDELRTLVEGDPFISTQQLMSARDALAQSRITFDRLLSASFDVVITPPAPGEAPLLMESEGSMVFNAMWTALHVPCIAIPVGVSSKGLPLGVQLVGCRGTDMQLLDIASICAPLLDLQETVTPAA